MEKNKNENTVVQKLVIHQKLFKINTVYMRNYDGIVRGP